MCVYVCTIMYLTCWTGAQQQLLPRWVVLLWCPKCAQWPMPQAQVDVVCRRDMHGRAWGSPHRQVCGDSP
jgi:hypothetical protein